MNEALIHLCNHLWSATGTLFAVAAVVFGRFYRDTKDRFFLLFSIGFLTLGAQYWFLALYRVPDESQHWLYVVRLIAFAFIVIAVVDKNRQSQ
ncbi:MAG: DUF5985 family protein [Myxococcaceae bacterium]